MKICLKKKYKLGKQKQNDQKVRIKKFLRRESNPKPLTCEVNALSIAPRQLRLNIKRC